MRSVKSVGRCGNKVFLAVCTLTVVFGVFTIVTKMPMSKNAGLPNIHPYSYLKAIQPSQNSPLCKPSKQKDTEQPQKKVEHSCPIPKLSKAAQATSWYPVFLKHLKRVDLSTSSKSRRPNNCARWWHPTPQYTYLELPDRGKEWKPSKKPPNYIRPNCTFGQRFMPKPRCAALMEPLWKKLDEMEVVYYPRDGTELSIIRGGAYDISDGDIDVFIDMPQERLHKALVNVLTPKPYLSGELPWVERGVRWKPKGCRMVHIFFSDWTGRERGSLGTHMDTCNCLLDSVWMTCHKDGPSRMYTQYGPSWRIPMHAKNLDMPIKAYRQHKTGKKLMCLSSKNGLIEEGAVRKLDKNITYSAEEMALILANLNVLKALILTKKPNSRC